MTSGTKFALHDRVTLNALGRQRSPKIKACAGTIRKVLGSQCDVLFDGNKTVTLLHETYLEHLPSTAKQLAHRFESAD